MYNVLTVFIYLFFVFLWMCWCATIWWWNKDVYNIVASI